MNPALFIPCISTFALLLAVSGMSVAFAGESRIASAYLGGINVPPKALAIATGSKQRIGDDGMPMVLSVQIDSTTLSPQDFCVISKSGVKSYPTCATLRPANEANELATILLAGPIANANDLPDRVQIIGSLKDLNQNELRGLVSPSVTIGYISGPSLVYAYHNTTINTSSGSSSRLIQMVWQGGVSGRNGVALGNDQLNAINIIGTDGRIHHPTSIQDDDGDNYVEISFPNSINPQRIDVKAGFFYDPMGYANPATSVEVAYPLPSQPQ